MHFYQIATLLGLTTGVVVCSLTVNYYVIITLISQANSRQTDYE